MLNPIKEIVKWQVDAGNASKPYEDFLESSFQVEEALEGFHHGLTDLGEMLHEGSNRQLSLTSNPKKLSRNILEVVTQGSDSRYLSDVERLDKACDAIVYAIGSMTKLGLDHHGITKALNIVNNANKAKLGVPRDEAGKLLKPDDFVGPEAELQKLLDSIK